MKRRTLFCALLFLLLWPVFAPAETWADFVARAEEAMAAGPVAVEPEGYWDYAWQAGDLVLADAGPVDGWENDGDFDGQIWLPSDPALTVPEGMRLVLLGGYFQGMLLGGGDFLLEDVTVVSRAEDSPAITLDNPAAPLDIRLELGHGCLVRSMDIRSEVIASLCPAERQAQSFPVSVHILNYGFIEAYVDVEAAGIDLCYANAGPDPVRLRVENYGDIGPDVRLYAVSHGDAEAILMNGPYARIEGREGITRVSAASRDGLATARVDNDAGARIAVTGEYQEEEPVLQLAVNQYAFDQGPRRGLLVLQNDGGIEGCRPLSLGAPLSGDTRLAWQDRGENVTLGDAALVLDMVQQLACGEEKLGEEDFRAQTLDWLRAQSLPELAADTPVLGLLSRATFEDGAHADTEYWRERFWVDWGAWAGE